MCVFENKKKMNESRERTISNNDMFRQMTKRMNEHCSYCYHGKCDCGKTFLIALAYAQDQKWLFQGATGPDGVNPELASFLLSGQNGMGVDDLMK